MERSLWVSVRGLIAGQVPDDQGLVARSRQEHVWVLERGREGGDPSAVALKVALENELFRHVEGLSGRCSIGLRRRVRRGFKIYREFRLCGKILSEFELAHPKGSRGCTSTCT